MNARGTVMLLGLLVIGCGSLGCDSSSTMGSNINTGVGGHAGGAGTGAGGAGGAVACENMYVDLGVMLADWEGVWLIQDQAVNQTCPNARTLDIVPHSNGLAPPGDPAAKNNPCPPPSAFHKIIYGSVKDCTKTLCPTGDEGYYFFVHALTKAGFENTSAPVYLNEPLYTPFNGGWQRVNGENISVTRDGVLTFLDFEYQGTAMPAGTCSAN